MLHLSFTTFPVYKNVIKKPKPWSWLKTMYFLIIGQTTFLFKSFPLTNLQKFTVIGVPMAFALTWKITVIKNIATDSTNNINYFMTSEDTDAFCCLSKYSWHESAYCEAPLISRGLRFLRSHSRGVKIVGGVIHIGSFL